MKDAKDYWFKRRRYGYGWTPVTWQGGLAVLAFVAIALGGALMIADTPEGEFTMEVGVYILAVLLSAVTLVRLGYTKGPAPRWRWGKKPGDDPDKDI